jgi:hypothetical protein
VLTQRSNAEFAEWLILFSTCNLVFETEAGPAVRLNRMDQSRSDKLVIAVFDFDVGFGRSGLAEAALKPGDLVPAGKQARLMLRVKEQKLACFYSGVQFLVKQKTGT